MMLLEKKVFLVKKKKKGNILRYTWEYEIYDPEANEQIGIVKNELTGALKVIGTLVKKRFLPKHLHIFDVGSDIETFSIKINTFSSKITVLDQEGKTVGRFDSKLLGGCYYNVYDANDREVGQIKGHIMAKDFVLLSPHDKAIGIITKSWDGVACNQQCCISPHDFIVALEDPISHPPETINMLLLAAGFAMDIALTKR